MPVPNPCEYCPLPWSTHAGAGQQADEPVEVSAMVREDHGLATRLVIALWYTDGAGLIVTQSVQDIRLKYGSTGTPTIVAPKRFLVDVASHKAAMLSRHLDVALAIDVHPASSFFRLRDLKCKGPQAQSSPKPATDVRQYKDKRIVGHGLGLLPEYSIKNRKGLPDWRDVYQLQVILI